MPVRYALFVLVVLAVWPSQARAQAPGDVTQVGSWSCGPVPYGIPNFKCDVSFPNPFGGDPKVVVTINPNSLGLNAVIDKTTAQGFSVSMHTDRYTGIYPFTATGT